MSKELIAGMTDGLDESNISSLISKYREVHDIKTELDKYEETIKLKIKNFMKERVWDDYQDEVNKTHIRIEKIKREDIMRDKLKLVLSPVQLSQVMHTIVIERMTISTPELKAKMGNFLGKFRKEVK